MEPRLRAIPKQFAVLLEFMERHGDLSRPTGGAQGRLKCDRLWVKLSLLLNSVGGGVQKSTDKWKKVWADWKAKTKKKYLGIRQHSRVTSNFTSSRYSLTALEERVVSFTGVPVREKQTTNQDQECNSLLPLNVIVLLILKETSATTERNATPSPLLETPTPTKLGRSLLSTRKNRGLTPFDRAASEFVAIEQRRLELEEARDKRLHEREIERLRLESQRIEVSRENNQLLLQLSLLGQSLLDVITEQRSFSAIPETVIVPDRD